MGDLKIGGPSTLQPPVDIHTPEVTGKPAAVAQPLEASTGAKKMGQASEGTHQRTPIGGAGQVALRGQAAEAAIEHTRKLHSLSLEANEMEPAEVVRVLQHLTTDHEVSAFLWSPEGTTLRQRGQEAFAKIASIHPQAILPGRAEPAEIERWSKMDAPALKSELQEVSAHHRQIGLQVPDTSDLDSLDAEQLRARHVDYISQVRSYPLPYLVATTAITEAQFSGASKSKVATLAQAALREFGEQNLGLNPWLKSLAE